MPKYPTPDFPAVDARVKAVHLEYIAHLKARLEGFPHWSEAFLTRMGIPLWHRAKLASLGDLRREVGGLWAKRILFGLMNLLAILWLFTNYTWVTLRDANSPEISSLLANRGWGQMLTVGSALLLVALSWITARHIQEDKNIRKRAEEIPWLHRQLAHYQTLRQPDSLTEEEKRDFLNDCFQEQMQGRTPREIRSRKYVTSAALLLLLALVAAISALGGRGDSLIQFIHILQSASASLLVLGTVAFLLPEVAISHPRPQVLRVELSKARILNADHRTLAREEYREKKREYEEREARLLGELKTAANAWERERGFTEGEVMAVHELQEKLNLKYALTMLLSFVTVVIISYPASISANTLFSWPFNYVNGQKFAFILWIYFTLIIFGAEIIGVHQASVLLRLGYAKRVLKNFLASDQISRKRGHRYLILSGEEIRGQAIVPWISLVICFLLLGIEFFANIAYMALESEADLGTRFIIPFAPMLFFVGLTAYLAEVRHELEMLRDVD